MSYLALYDICNFWDSPFYSHHIAQFFFELTGFNVFMLFLRIFSLF
jgi:hypothetical protein